jgi:hypothetical protein
VLSNAAEWAGGVVPAAPLRTGLTAGETHCANGLLFGGASRGGFGASLGTCFSRLASAAELGGVVVPGGRHNMGLCTCVVLFQPPRSPVQKWWSVRNSVFSCICLAAEFCFFVHLLGSFHLFSLHSRTSKMPGSGPHLLCIAPPKLLPHFSFVLRVNAATRPPPNTPDRLRPSPASTHACTHAHTRARTHTHMSCSMHRLFQQLL